MEDGMLSDFTIHEYSFTEAADVLGVSDTIDEAKSWRYKRIYYP